MIHERRQTHFWAFVLLACILPLGFLASLLWRPTFGPIEASADPLFEQAGFVPSGRSASATVLQSLEWPSGLVPIRGETLSLPGAPGNVVLALEPAAPIRQPDVLVYWQPGDTAPADALPENAIFLGSLVGKARREFPLPAAALGQAGQLLIYSPVKDAVFSALPLEAEATRIP